MYSRLYELWRQELQSNELAGLPSGFYSEIADYMKALREEGRMIDKRTVKAQLLKTELRNVRRMLRELVQARYKKFLETMAKGEKLPSNMLTNEEGKLCASFSSFADAYQTFAKNLLRGHLSPISTEKERRFTVLRFLKQVPAIVGEDMNSYGPFNVEDVSSLPSGNAQLLVKQGLAEKVEIS